MTDLELEAFLEIIRQGSISKAADTLYVTQPALSRRIRALETELGYELFVRKKGGRHVELTAEGELFTPIAGKLRETYRVAAGIKNQKIQKVLRVGSIGSVSTYILPAVMKKFCALYPEIQLDFQHCHSTEAYQYMEEGRLDLAIISDDMYCKNVETIPAFAEPMVLARKGTGWSKERIHPSMLNPRKEIRLPWTPEYDVWHDYWFGENAEYSVKLDQMSLLEYFLSADDLWAIVPWMVAYYLKDKIHICELEEGPPDEIIYYLKRQNRQTKEMEYFQQLFQEELERHTDRIRIYH